MYLDQRNAERHVLALSQTRVLLQASVLGVTRPSLAVELLDRACCSSYVSCTRSAGPNAGCEGEGLVNVHAALQGSALVRYGHLERQLGCDQAL